MNIWDVLKIEQTKDKDALKKAYRMRLSSVNPEDDPEGFMELRKAYEEAVRLADQEETTESSETSWQNPEEQALCDLYNNYARRIDPDCWTALFDTDYFVALDTCEDAFMFLMRFLLEHIFLPQKVWRVIVDRFDIAENKRELAEHYPENFLDYIINNAKYDDIINYELFNLRGDERPEQIDAYIRDYIELDRLIRAHNQDEAAKKISHIKQAYTFSNLYLQLCELRLQLQICHDTFDSRINALTPEQKKGVDFDTLYADTYAEEFSSIAKRAEALTAQAPKDITLQLFCGDIFLIRKQYDLAGKYYDHALSMNPDDYFVRVKQAEIAFRLGKFKSSRDQFMELLKENHYDDNVRIGMVRANQKMIEANFAHLKEQPDDTASKMEIGWSYYQSYQFKEAVSFLRSFEPDHDREFEYYNVLGRCYLGMADYNNARECFFTWAHLIESLPENDMSDDAEKKRKRYPYVNFLIADCYIKLKDFTQAEHYLAKALSTDHEEIILSYEALCELRFMQKQYMECLKACEMLIQKEPQDYIGFLFKARACKELKYIQEAYNACERAIHLYPYLAQPYAVETQLFLDAGQYDQAEDTIQRYSVYKSPSDSMEYCRARLYFLRGDHEAAYKILTLLAKEFDKENTDLFDCSDVSFLLGLCCLRNASYKEALQHFIKTQEQNASKPLIDLYIGSTCLKLGELEQAITYLATQIKKAPNAKAYSERGNAYFVLHDYKKAMADYRLVLSLEPDNAFACLQIGRIHEACGNYKAAADAYQKAYSLSENNQELLKDSMQFLARVYQCMNWFTESQKLYEDYHERYEWNPDIAYDYAVLLMRMGQTKQAITTLRQFLDNPACVRKLIEVYGDAGYIDLAHETFEYAINKDPQDIRAYGTMGDVFRRHELYEDAEQVYKTAIELDTKKEANYYSEWLECLVKRKSLRSIKKYIPDATLDKAQLTSPIAYIKMARLFRLLKDYQMGLSMLHKALKVPRCSGCFYSVCHRVIFEQAVLYEKQKNYAMARSMYEEAIKICGQNAYYEACLKKIEDKKK